MEVKLIQYTQNPIDTMYVAARTCYSEKSPIEMWGDINETTLDKKWKLVKVVLDSGHQSIAESVVFTFCIEGISRSCANQLTRHRAGVVFAQQSMRYVDASNFDFIIPDGLSKESYAIIGKILNNCREAYKQLVDLGVKKEDARSILPLCTSTNITMTVNFRQLIHLCHLRGCSRAQKEIRDLFKSIIKEVKRACPELATYLVPQCEVLGICTEKNCCGRKPTLQEVMDGYKASK